MADRKSASTDAGPVKKTMKPATSGPTIVGLMASKRLTSKLTSKLGKDRRSSSIAASNVHVEKEPSYRMEPNQKFSTVKARQILEDILSSRLERYRYNSKFARNMAKVLSDEIKDQMKALNYDRYKYICVVYIGEVKDQAMALTSRCAWDNKYDNSATYTYQGSYQGKAWFCNASVFGVYRE